MRVVMLVGVGGLIVCGCALRSHEPVVPVTREQEKESLASAIPVGTEPETAKSIMERRGYTVETVTDGDFLEKGGLDGNITAQIRHADFLLCRLSRPIGRITAQLITVAIVLKNRTTAEILVNEFLDGV
jgi:hypothetical protein